MEVDNKKGQYSNSFEKYKNVNSELLIDYCNDITPIVSIMIPTYKRPNLLKEALESVVSQKTEINYEIVIVDNDADGEFDNEIDNVISKLGRTNIRLFRNEKNIGMFGNWNRCIELARGKWISILNDDDELNPLFIENMIPVIQRNQQSGCIVCNIISNDMRKSEDKIEVLHTPKWKNIIKKLMPDLYKYNGNYISTSHLFFKNQINGSLGVLFEREKAINLGGFHEDYYPISDWQFWFRWAEKYGDIYRANYEGAIYRISQNESMKDEVMGKFSSVAKQLRIEWISTGYISKYNYVFIKPLETFEYYTVIYSFGNKNNVNLSKIKIHYIGFTSYLIDKIINPLISIFNDKTKFN